jgi:protein-S-isoprenylcysteine O-methyltransferase Ste14
MIPTTQTPNPKDQISRDGARLFAGIIIFITIQAAILFIAAGTIRWPAAWGYFGLHVLCYSVGLAWVASVNPAVINERGRRSTNTEEFDQRFHRIMPLLIFSGLIIGGLDHRFGWSTMPILLQAAGFLLLVPALFLAVWVLATNAYASRVVHLQDGHQVVTTGPYRIVRHPMYTGTLLAFIGSALALGSWWMFAPAVMGIGLFIWRTRWEDKTLMEKLPGYREFAKLTRYRLIPGVW